MRGHRRAGAQRGQSKPVSVDHYENFPVASVLCPPALRPAVTAIYWFARTADDLADEGDASAATRLRDLDAFHADLLAVAAGSVPSPRWAALFERLRPVLQQFKLPLNLLTDLLSAFRQDVVKNRYADRAELLDYCRRSANPIGRLLLHLYGVGSGEALRQSDAICTALQLANFWQDLSVDRPRGRHYVPQADARRHGLVVDAPELEQSTRTGPAANALLADLIHWARELMQGGAPLVHTLPGRAGWELRLVVQGGLRILEKTDALGAAALTQRPRVGALDAPLLLWRALWMRAPRPRPVNETP
ncbi:MAG: squalene synthase [Methylibium sp. NZG]|nr:MAG: squalene synthase [Methylibium sp. NZG]